ncbi:glycosyltransferase [Candidatus Dojkabacteria bacterium]|jgi:glycosyltransferase involved in cell wall biosynthesis|nr:glycosyltransferase [Candidatus Dojkabacteria bacterium]
MKKKNLKISIITPSFNKAEYIERAIKSVLKQDYKNWEHIIIDGGSTDNSVEILKKYKHLNWISKKDKGQSDAMNKGFAKSTGEIIVYLNADDYFYPGAFSAVISEFKKGAKFVVGNIFVKSIRLKSEFLNVPRTNFEGMLRHWEPNAFSHNAAGYFYLREIQEQCPFNTKNHYSMDIEFLLDAASKYSFTKIDFTLGCFEDGINTKTSNSQERFNHWQSGSYPYIDKHMRTFPDEKRYKFEEDRRKGYALVQEHMNKQNEEKFKDLLPKEIPLISVIMPNYNTEKYISRAINSVLSQGLKKLEIIVIDDGSTDNSLKILEKNFGKNPKVRIYKNKKNLKPGACRNKALDKAKGKYIFFQDADDWIEKGTLIHLASIAEKYQADIVACGVNMVHEDGTVTPYHSHAFACKGGSEALNYFSDYLIGSIIWNKLFSRELIEKNKIRFISPYINDDVVFTLKSIYACRSYISIANRYYNYFQKSQSIIRAVPSITHLRSYINIYKEFFTFIKNHKINKDKDGKYLAAKLIRAHCSNDVIPKLAIYTNSRSKEQWKEECIEASNIELGEWGYVFADFLMFAQNQSLPITQTCSSQVKQLEDYQSELQSIHSSKGWRLLLFARKIINKCLPHNSRRRQLFLTIYRRGKRVFRNSRRHPISKA